MTLTKTAAVENVLEKGKKMLFYYYYLIFPQSSLPFQNQVLIFKLTLILSCLFNLEFLHFYVLVKS